MTAADPRARRQPAATADVIAGTVTCLAAAILVAHGVAAALFVAVFCLSTAGVG